MPQRQMDPNSGLQDINSLFTLGLFSGEKLITDSMKTLALSVILLPYQYIRNQYLVGEFDTFIYEKVHFPYQKQSGIYINLETLSARLYFKSNFSLRCTLMYPLGSEHLCDMILAEKVGLTNRKNMVTRH